MESSSHTWAHYEVCRIEALAKADVILEVCNAMNGHSYSWKTIQQKLRDLKGNHDVHCDWTDICILKQTWDSMPSLTCDRQPASVRSLSLDPSWSPDFLRVLLARLRLITIRAGIPQAKAVQLVTQNIDGWLEQLEWEDLRAVFKKECVEGDSDDEETPLLGERIQKKSALNWFWNK